MNKIIFRQDGQIGYLTLNRPEKYNAVDKEMLSEFEEFINARMYDNSISVIILDGGDAKGFCAGLDMQTFGPQTFDMQPVDAYNAQARLSRMMLGLKFPSLLSAVSMELLQELAFPWQWLRIFVFYLKMPDFVQHI